MLKRIIMGLGALFLLFSDPAAAQGISQKVAVCNPSYTNRCMAPDTNGAIPITGSLTPSGTQNVNVTQIGGNAVTTTIPVSDGGDSLTVDTLQLPSSLGVKTAASSLSVAPASDSTFPVTQSGIWNITNVSGTISLPTGASTSALQATGNTSLSSIDSKLTSPLSIVGNVASLGADSGNPVKVGCVYNSTAPTVTTGQRVDCQATNRGESIVAFGLAGGGVSSVNGGMADGVTNILGTYRLINRLEVYNGSTWDRNRAVVNGTDSTGTGILAAGLVAQLDDTSPSTVTENQFGNLRMTQNRALLVRPYATASQDWTYAAASGGISNTTTAVTMVGATASLRNYVTACQISADALGAATEVVIRDGAGGTVLQRIKLTTAGLAPVDMAFPTPLKSSVNTLLEAATLTATITGGVYINCQGFTAP